jgi:hypothetical protein
MFSIQGEQWGSLTVASGFWKELDNGFFGSGSHL